MPVLPFLLVALCCLAIAYRYYSAFIATRVLVLDAAAVTPAHAKNDGHNYYPMPRWVLFGHHFAAITGAGPLIGPVLAAQFGFLPGYLWLLVGVTLGGAVHDFVILTASVRSGGCSVAEIARREIGPVAGAVTSLAIIFIVVIALAGLGLAVVNALAESPWGVFTIATSIPLALGMGLYIYKFNAGSARATRIATVVGVGTLLAAVVFGKAIPDSGAAAWFTLSRPQLTAALASYGFIAAVLPVWLLLCPRDYLSSYMKLGTIGFLILAVIVVRPDLRMPAFTVWTSGGGPIIPGKVFPFVFITIACGAISGFHALIASGTTPKMLSNETDARVIGYGAMLFEGLVGIVALIAAASLEPGDYFAINASAQKFAALGLHTVDLPQLELAVGEHVSGRTGGAVSLAVGMARIFSGLPFMSRLMSYWYHFAVMFEALFILTTIDAGTRVARFLVQEAGGRVWPQMGKTEWLPGSLLATGLVVAGWSYFILTGSISTIWPMFGVANQLLATIALCVGSTWLANTGRLRHVWITALPMLFVGTTTLTAAVENVTDNFLPLTTHPETAVTGWIDTVLSVVMIGCVVTVIVCGTRKILHALKNDKTPQPFGGSSAKTDCL